MGGFVIGRRELLAGSSASGLLVTTSPLLAGPVASCLPASPDIGWRDQKKYAAVFSERMAYYEVGAGRPIIFLHGNPTSSYLWRNIIPHVQHLGRCIAPDLIGMGDSTKLPEVGPGVYTYATHRKYLFELLRTLGVKRDIIFVIHDWGSALGFDFALHHPGAVRGIAYSEAILLPPSQQPPPARSELFDRFQTAAGETLILDQNIFVERLLIGGLKFYLTASDEMEYRRPFVEPGASRWPTLQWPRELPAYNKTNAEIIASFSTWLANSSDLPKLFLHAVPGAIFANPELLKFARSFPNQKEVTVYGGHFVQEVSPHAMGRALAEWIEGTG